MGALMASSDAIGILARSIKVDQHLIEINFSMSDNIKDSAMNIAVQAYNGELGRWSTVVSGPADTFQTSGSNYLVRTYWFATGIKVQFRLLATMENGDSIPSAAAFEYTPTPSAGSSLIIREDF